MRVLLTGGAGYIGSHTALALLERGHEVIVLDDFSNSHIEAVRRIELVAGTDIPVITVDLSDREATLRKVDCDFDAAVHLAGLKSVVESVAQPNRYYRVNLNATLVLLELLRERSVSNLVFSSSATVYGPPVNSPISEDHPVGAGLTNPYGWSKFMSEQIIRDTQRIRPDLAATLLRYFNPIGAHTSGNIGEDPTGVPTNLMPVIAQVASGRREKLSVFGGTYPTPDGTGVRDYIDVMDLAEGHVAALERNTAGVRSYNLGSGVGVSVLELVRTFEEQSERRIAYAIEGPRLGDLAEVVADPSRAADELGWRAKRTLGASCRDYWNWQVRNPYGYVSEHVSR
ncbi:UDP-glucose 4-epimerase GalE [Leucobacter sp. NPDC058333]|uniref:UDP-glucose 4-epimerase GalE n=1 Tax=Leucobacter sp. NPDC058333 TaxID=3346450 RepID=UPI003650DD0C